jgi:transcriptional regulator with XRE-family HTH domain
LYADKQIGLQESEEYMPFGNVIAEARKKAGLSQKELAARIEKEDGQPISPQYLNDIEHDRRSPSSDHIIEQFSKVLGIRSEILYYWAGGFPKDVKGSSVDEERVIKAYKAFRREIRGK